MVKGRPSDDLIVIVDVPDEYKVGDKPIGLCIYAEEDDDEDLVIVVSPLVGITIVCAFDVPMEHNIAKSSNNTLLFL